MRFYNYEVVLRRRVNSRSGNTIQVSVFTNGKAWSAWGPPGSGDTLVTPEEAIRQSLGRYGIVSIRKMKASE